VKQIYFSSGEDDRFLYPSLVLTIHSSRRRAMKVCKERTDDEAAPSRRVDESQREKEVCNGRQRQEG